MRYYVTAAHRSGVGQYNTNAHSGVPPVNLFNFANDGRFLHCFRPHLRSAYLRTPRI